MRILYFYQYFGTAKGCWSTRVYEFARRWVHQGDQVTVVTSVYDKSDLRPSGFLSRVPVEGIDVRVINVKLSQKHGFWTRILSFAAYSALACWYALTLRADVVVASSGPITVALPGLAARHLRGRPLVFEVRDLWPEGAIQLGILRGKLSIWLARALEKWAYRSATRIVTLSEGMAQWIKSSYGFDHISVVPNASDVRMCCDNQKCPPGLSPDNRRRLVLYAGTLGLIDDCRQILEMAAVLQQWGAAGVQVVIIGDGLERKSLEMRASQMNLRNVAFLGQMAKEEVMQWLQAADCSLFVCKNLPFLDTASPNKLFDAFAAGVPVVQTTQGWIKSLLEREQCGITITPGEPAELARAVWRVVTDRETHDLLAANSKRVGRDLFDRDLLASRMRRVLRQSVQAQPRGTWADLTARPRSRRTHLTGQGIPD